jgi:hypothetical protein
MLQASRIRIMHRNMSAGRVLRMDQGSIHASPIYHCITYQNMSAPELPTWTRLDRHDTDDDSACSLTCIAPLSSDIRDFV